MGKTNRPEILEPAKKSQITCGLPFLACVYFRIDCAVSVAVSFLAIDCIHYSIDFFVVLDFAQVDCVTLEQLVKIALNSFPRNKLLFAHFDEFLFFHNLKNKIVRQIAQSGKFLRPKAIH